MEQTTQRKEQYRTHCKYWSWSITLTLILAQLYTVESNMEAILRWKGTRYAFSDTNFVPFRGRNSWRCDFSL